MSPISRTSKRPSSGSGVRCHLHASAEVRAVRDEDVVHEASRALASSTVTLDRLAFQPAKTARVATRKDTLPPMAFDVVFARCATAPLMPALATFAK